MKYTQSIGNVNELKCLIGFIELGYDCSLPYGNNSKYDFIADVNGKLLKIQCKSSTYARRGGVTDENAFWIDTTSGCSNTHETVRHTYNKDDIDYFATCWNNKIYLIPVEECNTSKTLRLAPPKTNIPYFSASDYELEKVLGKNLAFLQSKEDFLSRFDKKIETENKESKTKEKIMITKFTGEGLFFTSDTHWCHENILKFCKRPFSSIEEHDKALIDNWNSVIGQEDTVFHLGDFCFGGFPKWKEIREQLNGHIILIIGNHKILNFS